MDKNPFNSSENNNSDKNTEKKPRSGTGVVADREKRSENFSLKPTTPTPSKPNKSPEHTSRMAKILNAVYDFRRSDKKVQTSESDSQSVSRQERADINLEHKHPNAPKKDSEGAPKEKSIETITKSGMVLRKRKRANTGCLSGLIYIVVVILLSFTLGTYGWRCVNDVLALMKTGEPVSIVYQEGMTITDLATELHEVGIIDYPWLFKLYCQFSEAEAKMNYGKYNFGPTDYRAIVQNINSRSEARTLIKVTIPEGLTQKEVFALLEEKEVAKVKDLEEKAASQVYRYEFLSELPYVAGRTEGYLFPSTYWFYIGEAPQSAIQRMLIGFNEKITAELRFKIESSDFNLHEIITIASLIEKEATGDETDRKNVSSVIHNRLKKWKNPYLQIDATIQYFLPERLPHLYEQHLAIDNPYNTYLYKGLPPGPICNPSISSIKAALSPVTTQYFYYVLNKEGTEHVFCKTEEEFLVAKAEYLSN